MKKNIRKILSPLLSIGATLSVGVLAYAGSFAIIPSMVLCTGSFILASLFENMVFEKSISQAFKWMFNRNTTKLEILEKDIQQNESHALHETYYKHIEYIKTCKDRIASLKNHANEFDSFKMALYDPDEIFLLKEKIRFAKKRMKAKLLLYFEDLDEGTQKKLQKQITGRLWLKRAGWLPCLAAGISMALVTLGTLTGSAIAALPFLAAFPPVILPLLAVFAGMGFSLQVYFSLVDMIRNSQNLWKKEAHETGFNYGLRLVGTVIAMGLAIAATIITAGAWWSPMKHTATLLHLSDAITKALQYVILPLQIVCQVCFSGQASIESVKKISESRDYIAHTFKDIKAEFANTHWNPFLILERILHYAQKPLLYLLHIVSIGFSGYDQTEKKVTPVSWLKVATNTVSEGLTDLYFFEESLLLKTFFLVGFTLPKTALRLMGAGLDFLVRLALGSPAPVIVPAHAAPLSDGLPLPDEWKNAPLELTCKKLQKRFSTNPDAIAKEKKGVIDKLAKKLEDEEEIKFEQKDRMILAVNRNSFWNLDPAYSSNKIEKAVRYSCAPCV